HSSSRSLPYMSPSRPMIDVPTDAETRNAVNSHVTPVSLVCRLCWKEGSAGITAELRTAYANPASDRTARISVGGALPDSVDSGGMDSTVADRCVGHSGVIPFALPDG